MISIKKVTNDEMEQYCQLIKEVFDFYIAADYSAKGVEFFYKYISIESMNNRYVQGGKYNHLGAYDGNELVGVIETRHQDHISLLFVKRTYQKQGIATALINAAFSKRITDITVNASPYAATIYEKLGFSKIAGELIKDGITFIPMIRQHKN